MKSTAVLSITFYVASLALVAGLTAQAANDASPDANPDCASPCCNKDLQIAEMSEQLKDEARWEAFILFQRVYPPFRSMKWDTIATSTATLSASRLDLENDLEELQAMDGDLPARTQMFETFLAKRNTHRLLRREFIRHVYTKVYNIEPTDPALDVL